MRHPSLKEISRASILVDALALLALFCLALVIRLPALGLVPPFWNTELAEALDAVEIARGVVLPLVVPGQPHLGAAAIYPLALVLRVMGFDALTPRMFAAVAGAFGVVATFGLGRIVGGRAVAFVAALLVLVNPFHILINSHIFWTNSLTPLFVTLAMGALLAALQEKNNRPEFSRRGVLALAFFLWGVALQSHPSVWTLVPGICLAIFLSASTRKNFRRAWSWFAPFAFLLGYANLIVFNALNNFESLRVLRAKSYALPNEQSLFFAYPERVREMLIEFARVVSAHLPMQLEWNVATIVLMIWFLGALALAVKKGQMLLVYPLLPAIFLLALLNRVYNIAYAERYIMFLLPLACVLMGLGIEEARHWLQHREHPLMRFGVRVPRMGARTRQSITLLCAVIILALLLSKPMIDLREFYARELQAGRSNQPYLAWNEFARAFANSNYRAVLDPALNQSQVVLNASDVGTTLEYFLRMRGVETEFAAEMSNQISRGSLKISPFTLPRAASGFEERGRYVVVCTATDELTRRIFIWQSARAECE